MNPNDLQVFEMSLKLALVTTASAFLTLQASLVCAQSLNVETSREPLMMGQMPSITLPKQQDNRIGQALPSDWRESTTVKPVENVTTEIVRTGGETTVSNPNEIVAPEPPKRGPAATPSPTQQKSAYSAGMVITGKAKVFDGHSLLVDNVPIRLNGIEAPAVKQNCQSQGGASWRCGEAARAALERLAENKPVICVVDAPAGTGAAATCRGQGLPDLGKHLVSAGMAVLNKHGMVYSADMSMARRKKVGLWVGNFTDPASWRRANR